MILRVFDDVLNDPTRYFEDIYKSEFSSYTFGYDTFHGIQPRPDDDEFSVFLLSEIPKVKIAYNFIRRSPEGQPDPNYIHTDEMMGDLTAILYLNKQRPINDGTTIYDKEFNTVCSFYSKFNSAIVFDSKLNHSRNIIDNFGQGFESRLIQIAFLKYE